MRNWGLALALVTACGGDDGGHMNMHDGGGSGSGDGGGSNGGKTVAGKMSFVLGGTGAGMNAHAGGSTSGSLTPNDEYLISPRKAKITFVSMAFRKPDGNKLGDGDIPFTSTCQVTYDRSLDAGATLLDCPINIPVGEVAAIDLNFNKAMQVLISDPTAGIYSDPAVATKFSTTEPNGGAQFVDYTIMIGDSSPTRGSQVILSQPVTIADGTMPQLFVTTDMVQTFQLRVNNDGTTLTPNSGNDPVALFAGLSAGTSRFYSNSGQLESYKIGTVQSGYHELRIFFDAMGEPLYLMSPLMCGGQGPRGVWASPPIGATIGGWLGKDGSGNISWALPVANDYAMYRAYMTFADTDTVGNTVSVKCEASASPPPPADNKTYASGAPAMPSPDVTTQMTLITK
jgi:hypothetical protein